MQSQHATTEQTVTSAQAVILEAGRAAHERQPQAAATLLALAQKKVAQLPPGERQRLGSQIAEVKQALSDKTPSAMPTPDDPGVVVVPKPTTRPPADTTAPTTPAPTTTPPASPTPTPTTSPSESATPTLSPTPAAAAAAATAS